MSNDQANDYNVMEEVWCDLCESKNHQLLFETVDRWHGNPGTFRIVQCQECRLIFINPRPNEVSIGNFYPSTYYAYSEGERTTQVPTFRKAVKRLVRKSRFLSGMAKHIPGLKDAASDSPIAQDISEWIPPGAVLDVGCGRGNVLDAMADMGWETYGIEPSKIAVDIAKKNGHQVFCQSATQPFPIQKVFDVV